MEVDMSPEAITGRLKLVEALRRLCVSLSAAVPAASLPAASLPAASKPTDEKKSRASGGSRD